MENLTAQSFSEHLNTKFVLDTESQDRLELEMVEVFEMPSTPRQERFSIVFRGDNNFFLSQKMYKLKHDKMGELELFLVPIKQDEKGYYYEAAFNRILK